MNNCQNIYSHIVGYGYPCPIGPLIFFGVNIGPATPSSISCDHPDTGSESQEIEIGVAGPIFTQKNIKGTMVKYYLYSTTAMGQGYP